MAQVITLTGERLFALKAQNNQQLDIDTFIFAYVPGQDSTAPIDRNEGLPPVNQRVHTQIVQQYGMINENAVVYSSVLDSLTGPFQFNWVGLYSAVNQTLIAIQHIPTVSKTVTEPGASGNILNRNFVIEYSGIAELTGITVDPATWQLDYTARLNGMDELTRQLAADMNGKDWFIGDGFKVVPRSTLNTFKVTAGVGYVSGLRVELAADHILTLSSYPQFVYVDAWFDGTSESVWKGHTAFTVTNAEMDDYIDVNGRNHYVFKLARITAADAVEDLRTDDGLRESLNKHIEKTRAEVTVADIKSGKYEIGAKLKVIDRDNEHFNVLAEDSYTVNDFDILRAGVGKVAVLQLYGRVNILSLTNGEGDLSAAFVRAALLSPIIAVPYREDGYNVNLAGNIGAGITCIFEGAAATQLTGTSTPQDLNAIGVDNGAPTGVLFSPQLRDKQIEVIAGSIRQEQPRPVTITRVGTSAIVKLAGHGYSVGDYIVTRGANETGFNGTAMIQQVDSVNQYRTLVDSSLPETATGSITAFKAGKWEYIKDASHIPLGVKDDEPVLSNGTGNGLFLKFKRSYPVALPIICGPDETIAGAQGMVVGASVGNDGFVIQASLNKTVAGRVYFDGAIWRVSMGTDQGKIYTYDAPYPFPNINYLAGNLELNHSFCLGEDVTLTACSTGGVVPYIPSLKVVGNSNATVNFIYVNPTTHALDLYTGAPNTSMSFRFNKNSNRQIKFDGSDRSSETSMFFGNIWFFGIMLV